MGELIEEGKKKAFNKLAEDNKLDPYEVMARKFYSVIPCYYDMNKNIFLYNKDEKKWTMSDRTDLVCIGKNMLGGSNLNEGKHRTAFINAIMDYARWVKPKEVPTNWIQFEDFFYDIETKERIKVDKNYFSQIKIPHKLGRSSETPIIDKHIKSWVGEDQYKLFVQICAYCMYKSYPFARFFIFYGTGQDGKSTAGDFISNLIGDSNSCTIDIDNLSTNRFEAQKLYQKTFAICGEVDYKLLKNTRKLKAVTGNDPITVEFKNKSPFQYKNFAKLLWYANGIPPTYDKTQGFYRRTLVLKFPNKFKENPNPLGNITEEEYSNFCLKCVDHLKDLLINCFDEKSIEDKTKEYEELSNPVLKFFNETIEESNTDELLVISELYLEYQKYSKKNAYRDFSYREFLAMFKNIDDLEVESRKIYKSEINGKHYESSSFFEGNYERKTKSYINGYKIKPILSTMSSMSSGFTLKNTIRESSGSPLDKVDKLDKSDENNIPIEVKAIQVMLETGRELKKEFILTYENQKIIWEYIETSKKKGIIYEPRPDVFKKVE